MNRTRTFVTGLTAALLLCGAGRAAAEISLVANHDHITIDFFYHGSSVSARGLVEPGTDVIIKIAGPDGKPRSLWTAIYRTVFDRFTDSRLGSLLFALAYLAVWIAVFGLLYRRRIFIRI